MAAGRAPTPRRRGFDSFRPCLTRPGLLADRGCRPLKPATRVRIPLGALTRPWCQRQHAGVPCLRCGFEPRRPLQRIVCFIDITCGALVLTGTRAACTREFGVRLPGAPPLLAVAQRSRAPPCDGGRRRFESSRRDLLRRRASAGPHRSDTPALAWFDSRVVDAPPSGRRGDRPPRRFREPETAGSNPADQTFAR